MKEAPAPPWNFISLEQFSKPAEPVSETARSWAYLSESLQVNSVLPSSLVLEAFNGLRLQTWFQRLAMSSGTRLLIFRQADDGCFVLPADESAEGYAHQIQIDESCERKGDEGEDISDFLKRLVARSRGIPRVAWAIWRYSLNIAIDKGIGEGAQEDSRS